MRHALPVICMADAGVAVKWLVAGSWAPRQGHVGSALAMLQSTAQGSVCSLQPPHLVASVASAQAPEARNSW